MSSTKWLGYNVKLELPVKYINLNEEFGGINPKIEYYIRKTGDVLKHTSNVKASMTDWDSHEKNSHINAIAKKALFLCQDGMKTKYPLEIADCWVRCIQRVNIPLSIIIGHSLGVLPTM